MQEPFDDYIERTPTPTRVPDNQDTVTFRLTGKWPPRWNLYLKIAGKPKKADILRDCLSLLFAAASTDASGQPVEVILRRRDEAGNLLPDVDLVKYLDLPTLQAYRQKRLEQANERDEETTKETNPFLRPK